MGFFAKLAAHATNKMAHPAIISERLSLTYGQLFDCVKKTALNLDAAGFGPSEVVGICIEDEVDHVIISLALLATGASIITLPGHDAPQLRTSLAHRVSVTRIIESSDAHNFLDYRCGASPSPAFPPGGQVAVDSVLYFRTSGTTGDVNVVPFSEAQVAAQADRHREYAGERLLRLASIEHNNSKRHRLYCVWQGGTNVFKPRGKFDLVQFVLQHRVSCLDISSMHASDLTALNKVGKLSGLKIRTGGSAVPYAVRRAIQEKVTTNLYVRYAATECGAISMAGPGDHDEAGAVGIPLDGVELQIVNDQGSRLPLGERGEIRIRVEGVASTYLNSPSDTSKRFRDGWFYPGDLGHIHAGGQLVLDGRTDDMIILNGLNIFPAEIERVLETHPDVDCVAALGLPSQVHGQIPVAAVILKAGVSVTTVELRCFARASLGLRAPRRIIVLDSFPRNSQGKVLKRELLKLFQ